MNTKIITIPLNRPIQKDDIAQSKIRHKKFTFIFDEETTPSDWQSIQMLLIQDIEPVLGDFYCHKERFLDGTVKTQEDYDSAKWCLDKVKTNNELPHIHRAYFGKNKKNGMFAIGKCIASYPQHDSLPPITPDDVKYIIELLNKGIDEVELEERPYLGNVDCRDLNAYEPCYLKLINNNVVVVRKEKICVNCDEITDKSHIVDENSKCIKQPRLFTEEDIMKALYFAEENGYAFYIIESERRWYKDDFDAGQYLTDKQLFEEYLKRKE